MKLVIDALAGERGGRTIFSNISFSLSEGQAMVVTGANGSGKSTLLRVVAGLLPAQAGNVALEGYADYRPAEQMHYLGHLNGLKPALSVEENLGFWQRFCASPLMEIEHALEAVGLGGIGHLPAASLSAGQKRRVSIAKLLVTYKPVWIVDEPTAALDKASENLFSSLVGDHLKKGGITIAATHKPLDFGQSGGIKIKSMNLDTMPVEDLQRFGDSL